MSVIGTTGIAASAADNGIQFAGFDGADHSVDHAIGSVNFQNVAVSGTYEKTLVYVQGYDNLNGLSFANGLSLGGAGSQTTWTGLFIDGGPQGGAYVSDGTSTLNLTGVNVSGGTFGTSPSFAALGSKPIVVNGVATGDIITGTDAAEAFIGSTGNDVINAGGGDDLVLYSIGDGQDTVDGQGGNDTLALINFAGGAPSATSATFAVTENAGHLIVQTDGADAPEVDALGMESVQAQLGNGGDTVTLTGNLVGAGISTGAGGIAITGGSGADTVDASGLTSVNAITFTNLNTGDDTFKAANVLANDQVDGGTGGETIGDTADYSAASAAVTINLVAGTAVGTSVGSDVITHFENATGGAGNDTISGTANANILSGGDGNDTITGGGGDDTIHGGAGSDVAIFSGNRSDYTITWDGNVATVQDTVGGRDGADTIDGVGELRFSDGSVWLVSQAVGSDFTTIQSAVDAAHNGDQVLVAAGTYAEQVLVDGKNLTLTGENGAIIDAPNAIHPSFNIPTSGTPNKFALIGVENATNVTIDNFQLNGLGEGDQASGGDFNGVFFWNASGHVLNSSVTGIRDGGVAGSLDGAQRGNAIVGLSTDGGPHTLEVADTTVSGFQKNGIVFSGAGMTGNAHDNTVTGAGQTAAIAQNGIEVVFGATGSVIHNIISGIDYSGANTAAGVLMFQAATGVVVNNNTITGAAGDGDAGVYFFDTDGASAHGNTLTNLGFGLVDEGAFTTPVDHTADHTATGTDDNTFNTDTVNIQFDPDTSAATAYTFSGSSGDDVLEGGAAADSLNGAGGDDFIEGFGGADVVHGDAGNDTIVWNAGDGNDTIDGDSETDTLQVAASGHNLTLTAGAGNFTITDNAGSTATVSEVEEVNITLSGGETVTINGDFTGTGVNIGTFTIDGSAGTVGETVDARNLISAHEVDFTGGSGGDTFYSGPGDDTFRGGAGNDTVNYTVGDGADTIDGGADTDTLNVFGTTGDDTIHVSVNGSGAITSIEGSSPTGIEAYTANGLGGNDTLDYSGSGTNPVTVNLATGSATGFTGPGSSIANIENATGGGGNDALTGNSAVNTLTGGGGDDTLTGTGNDTLIGGTGDDTYNVKAGDTIVENSGEGTDSVFTTDSYTLSANVENLTLVDNGVSNTQTFDDMSLGPIIDGENGWKVGGPNAARDQEIVSVGGNQMFRMSSDPSVADFAGPYSPELSSAAGEPDTGAPFDGQSIRFNFQAVNATPDGSRLEIDFGNAAGTDRNNFLVIELFAGTGIRIAVSEPIYTPTTSAGGSDFTGDENHLAPNDWRELASGVGSDRAAHARYASRLRRRPEQRRDQHLSRRPLHRHHHDVRELSRQPADLARSRRQCAGRPDRPRLLPAERQWRAAGWGWAGQYR